MDGRPLDVLEASLGDRVSVTLKSDTECAGTLTGFDEHLNLVIEDGESDNTTVIRGDNVVSLTL